MKNWITQLPQIQWNQRDRIAPWILALLILILCWKLAALFWWLVAPPQAMQVSRVELGSQQAAIPNIRSFSPFYEPEQQAATNDNLNMSLQGVLVSYPAQFSSAVIKITESAERYRVGETLENTAYQLAEVYWDHVLLRHQNGSTRELRLGGLENGLNQAIVPPVTTTPAPSTTAQTALGQAIGKMQNGREQYLQEMGVSASGEGYEVSDRTPLALRNKLGLRPGDRIISLNGQIVGQGQSDTQLLEQARRDGQVKLEIKRGDQVMTIQQNFLSD